MILKRAPNSKFKPKEVGTVASVVKLLAAPTGFGAHCRFRPGYVVASWSKV